MCGAVIQAGMAKLADAADLKSAGAKALWGFDSPSRHQDLVLRSIRGAFPGGRKSPESRRVASAQYGYSALSDARFYSLPSPWSLNCCVVPTKNSSYLRLPAVADSSPLILPQISSAGPESGSACTPCAE